MIITESSVDALTRSACAAASLEQNIVRHSAPVLAGVKPAAMFSCSFTRKPKAHIEAQDPHVMLIDEYTRELERCRAQLAPHGVHIRVLAWRDCSALMLAYRPQLLAQAIGYGAAFDNLTALGYAPRDLRASLDELSARMRAFDSLNRPREFWDFPHEVGYFLGYPAADVMAFVRNRGRGSAVSGKWVAYGCPRRAQHMSRVFQELDRCTDAYWDLYLQGAQLGQLAALGTLQLEMAC